MVEFGVIGKRPINLHTVAQDDAVRLRTRKKFGPAAGFANRAGEQMKQGLSGSLDALSSAIQSAFIATGRALEPIITPLIQGLTSIVSTFADLPAPIQAALAGIAGFTAVVAAGIGIVA